MNRYLKGGGQENKTFYSKMQIYLNQKSCNKGKKSIKYREKSIKSGVRHKPYKPSLRKDTDFLNNRKNKGTTLLVKG